MMNPRKTAPLSLPIACILALTLGGCVTGGPHLVTPDPPPIPQGGDAIPADNVAVLSDGNQIVAETAAGGMKIEAGPGLRRVFDWDGLRRGVVTHPRTESFAGGETKGITFDGKPSVWADANGIDELKYEEGRRHFDKVDDAMIWMQIRRLYFTYTNQGLVLGWRREGNTLHVELWQFYIDGNKPISLPDAHDGDVAEGKRVVKPQTMHPHLAFKDGHTEPYDASAADQYNPSTDSSGPATAKKSSSCNWFQSLFTKCSNTSADDHSAAKDAEKTQTPDTSVSDSALAKDSSSASNGATGSTASEKTAPTPAQNAPKAEISGSTVNIRSGSGTTSDVLFQAKAGDQVEILKDNHDWRYVKFDDDRKGWVADFLLKHPDPNG